MLLSRVGALWDPKDGLCLLDLCAPQSTTHSEALCRALGYRNAYNTALVSAQGATGKGERPVTTQVQPYCINAGVRRSPGSWGSQRRYSWPLRWEGVAWESFWRDYHADTEGREGIQSRGMPAQASVCRWRCAAVVAGQGVRRQQPSSGGYAGPWVHVRGIGELERWQGYIPCCPVW